MRLSTVVAIALMIQLAASGSGELQQPGTSTVLASHDPILIDGDAEFTPANGVTGGLGTSISPYLISNWSISVSMGYGIEIRNTTVPFVLQNLEVNNPLVAGTADVRAVHLENVSGAAIRDFSAVNMTFGVYAERVRGLSIRSGTIQLLDGMDGVEGLVFVHGTNLTVDRTAFSGGLMGVNADSASNMSFSNCSFDNIEIYDMELWSVRNVTVVASRFQSQYVGLAAVNSSGFDLQSDLFVGHEPSVYFLSSNNATMVGNVFRGPDSIAIQFDVDSRYPDVHLSDFTIFHNNFINRTVDILGRLERTEWDQGYPSGGNFWTVYTGVDECRGADQRDCSNRDGIIDTPFVGNFSYDTYGLLDHYPFVGPYPPPQAPPNARVSSTPGTGNTDTTFVFDASTSTDPVEPIGLLQFRWDLDGNSAWDTGWSVNSSISHRFTAPGSYSVKLQVRNTAGLLSQANLTVVVVSPPVDLLVPVALAAAVTLCGSLIAVLWHRSKKQKEGRAPPSAGP